MSAPPRTAAILGAGGHGRRLGRALHPDGLGLRVFDPEPRCHGRVRAALARAPRLAVRALRCRAAARKAGVTPAATISETVRGGLGAGRNARSVEPETQALSTGSARLSDPYPCPPAPTPVREPGAPPRRALGARALCPDGQRERGRQLDSTDPALLRLQPASRAASAWRRGMPAQSAHWDRPADTEDPGDATGKAGREDPRRTARRAGLRALKPAIAARRSIRAHESALAPPRRKLPTPHPVSPLRQVPATTGRTTTAT